MGRLLRSLTNSLAIFLMPSLISSMTLATFGLVLYNIAQKNQPATVHPFQILSITYLIAATVSLTLYKSMPDLGVTSFKSAFFPAALLGLAVICVELGFLLVYRSGWNIGVASTFSNVAATAVLLPISAVFLQDKLEAINIFGVVLCLLGLFFVSR